jgi:fructokinase
MRIGIDLGGTKIEGVALANTGQELGRLRVPTPRSYEATVVAIAELVESLEQSANMPEGYATVGVGIPGAIVPDTGLVKNANSIWLIGKPLGLDLEERLTRPVRIANDANCFALSEASDGAGAGAGVVFGVILGTGVGGGIVVNGQCLVGANLITGEWGHNALPWPMDDERPGPSCYCGKHSCIESWLSGPAFEKDHALHTGQTLAARDINLRAAEGDTGALASLARYHDRLARALASVINLLDPDIIVLGGGMSNTPGLADATKALLPRWVFSDSMHTRIVHNVHGDSSGVRGAAWLWPLEATV